MHNVSYIQISICIICLFLGVTNIEWCHAHWMDSCLFMSVMKPWNYSTVLIICCEIHQLLYIQNCSLICFESECSIHPWLHRLFMKFGLDSVSSYGKKKQNKKKTIGAPVLKYRQSSPRIPLEQLMD